MLDEVYVAMATNSDQLRVMNLETHDCASVMGHKDIILCVDVHVDGNGNTFIATSSKDTHIRVWTVNRNQGHVD
eukprot:Pgem_evm1s11869